MGQGQGRDACSSDQTRRRSRQHSVDKASRAGGIGKGATGTLFVDGQQVAQGQIPQTVSTRFSLDETFDVGEDTGTPVIEDYVDKMPYPFTGTLKKFVVVLEPEKLTDEERKRLLEAEARSF